MLNFSVCAGEGGGRGLFVVVVVVVVVNVFFSNSELNTKSFSCQTNIIWKNISIDNISIVLSKIDENRCKQTLASLP